MLPRTFAVLPTTKEERLQIFDRRSEQISGVIVRQVFAYFQNLNLRILIEDLRLDRVTRGNWSYDNDLCPIAHGLCDGHTVGMLRYLSQAKDLQHACERASQDLGTSPKLLYRFLTEWDAGNLGSDWLLAHLERIWAERLEDATMVQRMLEPSWLRS